MPLPKGTRYRFKTLKSGKKVRLAFAPGSSKVLEVVRFKKERDPSGKLKKKVLKHSYKGKD